MPLQLMYITNKPEIARIAEDSGVDWIFTDLEVIGKAERQGSLDTVISHHHIDDVKKIRRSLTLAKLLVRINPVYEGTTREIRRVIDDGADILMLPYFKTVREVKIFIEKVNGRAKTCLLFETPGAVEHIDEIIALPGIDYIHIGLNDLHLGYGMKFMFELLSDGTVETLCKKFAAKKIAFGFGGIARLGSGQLPAEKIIAEHYRLGSGMAILSRSFCNSGIITDGKQIEKIFKEGMKEIRELEKTLVKKDGRFFNDNHKEICQLVEEIVKNKQESEIKIH